MAASSLATYLASAKRMAGAMLVGPPIHVPASRSDAPMNHPSADAAHPDAFSADDRAAHDWLANVYQGDDARQLTLRAVLTGMLIGGVMSISNLYVGLKTGWSLGVTITACIIAYAVFSALERALPFMRARPFTILENYTMSSAASAAGFMSSAGLVSSFPALYLATDDHRQLTWWEMMSFLSALSLLGVFMAIPLKRQLINVEKLPFPSGIATAETLRSMHTAGREAVQKARALFWAATVGAVLVLWRDALPAAGGWLGRKLAAPRLGELAARLAVPDGIPLFPGGGRLLDRYTIGLEGSLIMAAAGAIMGIRVGTTLLVGAVLYWGVVAPILVSQQIVEPGFRGVVSWTIWPATSLMVVSGLLSFALRWQTIVRALGGLARVFTGTDPQKDALAAVEVPGTWFGVGTAVCGLACIVMGHYYFQIDFWMGGLAVLLTFLLSVVAARATGETDVTPIGAMGKITQLTYGMIEPTSTTTNLMTATITAGAASHSADLLTDLKSGYLLGGNPRKQTISQLCGVLAGALVCVPVYTLIVDYDKLGTPELPAPAAVTWAGVARLMNQGLAGLPAGSAWGMVAGGCLGIVLTLLEEFLPKRRRKWLPSATALGIAGVIPAFNAFSMFLGALVAWRFAKVRPAADEKYTIAVSSGLIAGESLLGVGVRLWDAAPGMAARLWDALRG